MRSISVKLFRIWARGSGRNIFKSYFNFSSGVILFSRAKPIVHICRGHYEKSF